MGASGDMASIFSPELTRRLIIMNVGIVIITIVAMVYFISRDKLKRSGRFEEVKRKKLYNRYIWYKKNLLLRNRFSRVETLMSSLSCWDEEEVKIETVKLFEGALKISLLMPTVCLITMRDVVLTILVAFIGYIYYDIAIDKKYDKMYKEIMVELSMNIQSIRDKYMEHDNPVTAVLTSEKGKYLDKPVMGIYEMLTSIDADEALDNFCQTSPVRLIKTLATTCFIVNEVGDEKRVGQQSAFSEELTSLMQETDTEIRRLESTRVAFKSLPIISLIGIICIPLCDAFLLNQIPGTSVLLKGMYGSVTKSLIIATTILAYYIISILTRPSVVNKMDKIEWIDNQSKRKRVKNFIRNLMPKKQITIDKLQALINGSISQKDFEYIYLAKCIFASITFVGVSLLLWLFVITSKSYLINNYNSLSFTKDNAMEERVYNQVVKMDKKFMALPERLPDEEILKFVKANVRGMKELDMQKQAERLGKKWDNYYGMKYHWWFFIISYLCAWGAWFGPEMSLRLRKMLVEYEATEDVLQLQTMMIVLSNTKMDVRKALGWLEKQSSIHSDILKYAYLEYSSDPELALDNLYDKTSSLDFKKLISKLKSAMYSLSLEDAFSDMKLNKEQSLLMREIVLTEQLESKKQWAKLICVAPAALMLIFNFVGPIIILGFTQLVGTLGSLNNL